MRKATFLAILCLLLWTVAVAANDDFTLPVVGQPADFSRMAGVYTLSATATPTEVFVGEPILLKVTITGSGPQQYQPQRRYLQIFRPEMEENFFIEPLPQEDRYDPESKTWEFYYHLRPKSEEVTRIPALRLAYYHYEPGSIERYQRTYAGAINVKIKPRPREIVAPARMYQIAKGENILQTARQNALNWPLLLLGLVIPPLGCAAWYRIWQYLYPDEARLRQRRRSRAGRWALRRLKRLSDVAPPEQIAAVVNRYFQDYFGIRAEEPTAMEMQELLRRAGYAEPAIQRTAAFFRLCHESRFAPPDVLRRQNLRGEARQLIEAMEGER